MLTVGLDVRHKELRLIPSFLVSVTWGTVVLFSKMKKKMCFALVQVANMNQVLVRKATVGEMG